MSSSSSLSRFFLPLWILSSHFLALLPLLITRMSMGDISYLRKGVRAISQGKDALGEYPEPGVWYIYPLWKATVFFNQEHSLLFFQVIFIGGLIILSLLFSFFLLYYCSPLAAFWYSIFILAAGPISFLRLDILVGLVVAISAFLLYRKPQRSFLPSFLLALATSMKLWPGVLAAGLIDSRQKSSTWKKLFFFVLSLVVINVVTAIRHGWGRVLSPLDYQSDRGLQIESIAATPLVFASHFRTESWSISYAPSKSFEIYGPGVQGAISLSNYATFIFLLSVCLFALYSFLTGVWSPRTAVALWIFTILGLIITNKVFSPQYIVWLAPLFAMYLSYIYPSKNTVGSQESAAAAYKNSDQKKTIKTILTHTRIIAILYPLVAILTMIVFPLTYDGIIRGVPDLFPLICLSIKNGLLIVLWYSSLRILLAELSSEASKQKYSQKTNNSQREQSLSPVKA